MSLRDQLEAIPPDQQLVLFTTLGHVYVGRIVDIDAEAIRLARSDGAEMSILSLNDVSGVRVYEEEVER